MNFIDIARGIAAEVRHTITSRQLGASDLVSLTDHTQRAAFSDAMRDDEKAMVRALMRALVEVATEHAFCDVHVWTESGAFVSLQHADILALQSGR